MASIRWSTPVRDGCGECFTDGLLTSNDLVSPRYVGNPDRRDEWRLCRNCSSCWYVFAHVNGYVAAYHRACDGFPSDATENVPHEDCAAWEAPPECRCADDATTAVRVFALP